MSPPPPPLEEGERLKLLWIGLLQREAQDDPPAAEEIPDAESWFGYCDVCREQLLMCGFNKTVREVITLRNRVMELEVQNKRLRVENQSLWARRRDEG